MSGQPEARRKPIIWVKWLRSLYYWLFDAHYRRIKRSGLLDYRYYFDLYYSDYHNPQTYDPVMQYVKEGWRDGFKPNAFFNPDEYRQKNPGAEGRDPLLHYIEGGWCMKYNRVSLLLDDYYIKNYPESAENDMTPLGHYLSVGWRRGCKPNPLFDNEFYLNTNPDVASKGINPLAHYHYFGRLERRLPIAFFDSEFYIEDNPSITKTNFFPILHFIEFGAAEGRSPNRFFDPAWYRERYLDETVKEIDVFLHYVEQGSIQHLRPWRLFDSRFYVETYPEYQETALYPLMHYQQSGVYEGYYPCAEVADLEYKPTISVLTPVFNTDEKLLRRCIHSVLYQAYPHWQLCLVDDGSSEVHVKALLDEYAALDSRIKVKMLASNQGIAAASNEAASLAVGDYLAFLDHDDELTLDALYEMTRIINKENADLIYSDEDLVNLESRHQDLFLKPAYNRELLLSHNYITHFLVCRRQLFDDCGGFSSAYDGSQDYGLTIELCARAGIISHIDRVLYHWRAIETSTSINHEQKKYADAAGARALAAAMKNRGIDAEVLPTELRFFYRARRRLRGTPSVSLICWFPQGAAAIKPWYRRMETRLGYAKLSIFCICSGQGDAKLDDQRIKIIELEDNQGMAAGLNQGAAATVDDHLLFVHAALLPEEPDWIESLLEYSQDPAVGAVGGRIKEHPANPVRVSADPELDNLSAVYFRRFFIESSRHLNGIHCAQNVLAVSADLCMVKRRLFEAVNGFDAERFPSAFFDADFCLRLREIGNESVYTPYSCLVACEADTKEAEGSVEMAAFKRHWYPLLHAGDPYYNVGRVLQQGISLRVWQQWFAGAGKANQF